MDAIQSFDVALCGFSGLLCALRFTVTGPLLLLVILLALAVLLKLLLRASWYEPRHQFSVVVRPRALASAAVIGFVAGVTAVAVYLAGQLGWTLFPDAGRMLSVLGNLDSWFPIVLTFHAAIALTVVVAARRSGMRPADLGFKRPIIGYGRVSLVGFAGLVTVVALHRVTLIVTESSLGENAVLSSEALAQGSAASVLATAASMILVGPAVEEVLYRGMLFAALRAAAGRTLAILVQAVAFALAHGVDEFFPFYVAFGVICAIVYQLTGTILLPILVHALGNLLMISLEL